MWDPRIGFYQDGIYNVHSELANLTLWIMEGKVHLSSEIGRRKNKWVSKWIQHKQPKKVSESTNSNSNSKKKKEKGT